VLGQKVRSARTTAERFFYRLSDDRLLAYCTLEDVNVKGKNREQIIETLIEIHVQREMESLQKAQEVENNANGA